MKLKDQVCSFELAKKLKELGVKQESLWYWYIPTIAPHDRDLVLNSRGRVLSRDGEFAETQERLSGYEIKEKFSAFTVAELDERLPHGVSCGKTEDGMPWCALELIGHNYGCGDDNGANTRAKMLIYLIENKLVDISAL